MENYKISGELYRHLQNTRDALNEAGVRAIDGIKEDRVLERLREYFAASPENRGKEEINLSGLSELEMLPAIQDVVARLDTVLNNEIIPDSSFMNAKSTFQGIINASTDKLINDIGMDASLKHLVENHGKEMQAIASKTGRSLGGPS